MERRLGRWCSAAVWFKSISQPPGSSARTSRWRFMCGTRIPGRRPRRSSEAQLMDRAFGSVRRRMPRGPALPFRRTGSHLRPRTAHTGTRWHFGASMARNVQTRFTRMINSRCAVAFSPDGRDLIAGGMNGVHMWHVAEPAHEVLWMKGEASVFSLALSPDGRYLLSSDTEGNIDLWSLVSKKHLVRVGTSDNVFQLSPVTFSPDGRLFAAPTSIQEGDHRRPQLTLWETAAQKKVCAPLTLTHDIHLAWLSPPTAIRCSWTTE